MNDSVVKTEDGNWKKVVSVDQIEYLLNKAFYQSDIGGFVRYPHLRYKLLIILLQNINDYLLGFDIAKTREEVRLHLDDDVVLSKIEKYSERIQLFINDLEFKPTYTAISYWSPVDH